MFSKKLTILYPILHYPPVIGGLEQWAQNIAERQPADVEILVVTGRVRGEPNFVKNKNVAIFRTSLFSLQNLSHSSMLYIATSVPFIFLRSLFLSKDICAFHCHGLVSALMGYFLASITRKPFIGTEQSMGWANSKFRGFVYRRAALCIASSSAVAREFESIGASANKIKIIPNGVDLEKFSNVRSPTPHIKGSFIILQVGRLEKVKGHKYLLDAFAAVVNATGSDPAESGVRPRLIIIGDGSERGNLETQARELDIKESIEFTGEIPHNELPYWYRKADVFVMPSLSEGFGIAVIEAMAAKVPVVASDTGGLLDVISDGINGLFVRAGDSQAIARAILFLYHNPQTAGSLRKNGFERAREYSWDSIALRIANIYHHSIS
jgi:glycosyltransferase involved in cell wall biosynthesis